MNARSIEFWKVAYFLSKFGEPTDKNPNPPRELQTQIWNEAYRMFYESLGESRSVLTFEHSLKNARDSYDSHLGSGRIGWMNKSRRPNELNDLSKSVFDKGQKLSRQEVWEDIESLVDLKSKDYEWNDLISEDIWNTAPIKSRTEGGKVVFVSFRIERSPSLRNEAFRLHGYDCMVCGFNFEKTYGHWGKYFAEVHHLVPLADDGGVPRLTNPKSDLVIICANCHRMVHRKRKIVLSVLELKSKIKT